MHLLIQLSVLFIRYLNLFWGILLQFTVSPQMLSLVTVCITCFSLGLEGYCQLYHMPVSCVFHGPEHITQQAKVLIVQVTGSRSSDLYLSDSSGLFSFIIAKITFIFFFYIKLKIQYHIICWQPQSIQFFFNFFFNVFSHFLFFFCHFCN